MKYIFIMNPIAGKTRFVQELQAEIDKVKSRTGYDIEVYLTEYPQHATKLVREIAQKGEPVRFYACGGDGTLNEVLCGAYGFDNVEVGHIPCGSGNDMIRNFGSAESFRNIEAMMRGESRTIDLIEANGRAVASICAAGMDGKICYQAVRLRRFSLFSGGIAYDIAAVKCLLGGRLWYRMQLNVDGKPLEGDFILTAFGNGQYYGGGYKSIPGALLDDGLLSVVLVHKMPFYRLFGALKKYKAGEHFNSDGKIIPEYQNIMTAFSAKEITVHCDKKFYYTIDGEVGCENDMKIRILPGAIRFILPERS